MAYEMTVPEGTIPNAKEVEARLMEIGGSLMENNKYVEGLDRGLSYVVEQVDQLEQNLSAHLTQPAPDREQLEQGASPGLQHSGELEDGP
eukprot:10802468-Prorocentrum_lima.AAC.1